MTRPESCNALLVYPEFRPHSFWNYQETCRLAGARYSATPLGLITVAALLPPSWSVRLVNRNTERLEPRDLAWADIVLTGGMLPQQPDALRIIAAAHAHGKPVLVGGPDVSSSPHVYEAAEFQVLGEAEGVMEEFLSAWHRGDDRGVFQSHGFPDMSASPIPRFDLLKFHHYLNVGVQFSRGCPFQCEFCGIIELYGRQPRLKSDEQMLRELDALHALGYRGHVDFVDDNLIGNRRRLKEFLPKLREWLDQRGRPFEFTTEASINLADDPDLLALMKRSNFFAVFIGIESPDPDTLVHTQKRQNTHRVLHESIARIYRAGMFVSAGFIIGFDSERSSVAEGMIECIEEAAIPVCMVGLLYALPNTQLTRRLSREGRLHPDHDRLLSEDATDQCTAGLNFQTMRPRRDVLADYRTVLDRVYDPARYFERVRRLGRQLDCSQHDMRQPLPKLWREVRTVLRLAWRLGIRDPVLRGLWWRTVLDCARHNPRALRSVLSLIALYLHLGPFARYLSGRVRRQIAALEVDGSLPRDPATEDVAGPEARRQDVLSRPVAAEGQPLGAGLR